MKRITLIAIIIAFVAVSCTNNKEKELKKIQELEKVVLSNETTPADMKKAKELVDAFVKFANENPKDTNAVTFLFKAANISMNIDKAKQSVELFDKILKDYPSFDKASDCMFLKAFVLDDKLKNINEARKAYEAFINKYPSHEFTDDAKACLNNLGKTPEQLIKEFEAKNDSLSRKK